MNLGIESKWALVCAASKGLGKGCAAGAAAEGVELVITARGAETLEATAEEIRALRPAQGARRRRRHHHAGGPAPRCWPPARSPTSWSTTPADRPRATSAMEPRRVDPGARRQHADADRADQGDGRRDDRERGFGRIVNITSGAVKAPIAHARPLQRRAHRPHRLRRRPGARNIAAHNVTINGLLPGPFDTDRFRGTPPRSPSAKAGPEEESRGRRRRCRRALRQRRGVRRGLRLPLQRARRLHQRAEPAARRRRLPGDVLAAFLPLPLAGEGRGEGLRAHAGMSAPQFQH